MLMKNPETCSDLEILLFLINSWKFDFFFRFSVFRNDEKKSTYWIQNVSFYLRTIWQITGVLCSFPVVAYPNFCFRLKKKKSDSDVQFVVSKCYRHARIAPPDSDNNDDEFISNDGKICWGFRHSRPKYES